MERSTAGIFIGPCAIPSLTFARSLLSLGTMSDSAPESTLPYPPVHKDKKFVILSDWLVCYKRCLKRGVLNSLNAVFVGMVQSRHTTLMIVSTTRVENRAALS